MKKTTVFILAAAFSVFAQSRGLGLARADGWKSIDVEKPWPNLARGRLAPVKETACAFDMEML